MGGVGRPIDKAVINEGAVLDEIRMDLPRLRRYKAELERNIAVIQRGIDAEQARLDHVDHIIETLEAKEAQQMRRLDLLNERREAIDSGAAE